MFPLQIKIRKAKSKIAFFSRLIGQKQLSYASFGNLSVKIGNNILLKNRGVNLELAQPSDFSSIVMAGDVNSYQDTSRFSSEWKMHLLSYIANPGYNAILHLHPLFISILDGLSISLESDDLEFRYLLKGKIRVLPELEPASIDLAQKVAEGLKTHQFLILRKHGIVVAAKTVEESYNYSIAAEEVAKKMIYLRLLDKIC